MTKREYLREIKRKNKEFLEKDNNLDTPSSRFWYVWNYPEFVTLDKTKKYYSFFNTIRVINLFVRNAVFSMSKTFWGKIVLDKICNTKNTIHDFIMGIYFFTKTAYTFRSALSQTYWFDETGLYRMMKVVIDDKLKWYEKGMFTCIDGADIAWEMKQTSIALDRIIKNDYFSKVKTKKDYDTAKERLNKDLRFIGDTIAISSIKWWD